MQAAPSRSAARTSSLASSGSSIRRVGGTGVSESNRVGFGSSRAATSSAAALLRGGRSDRLFAVHLEHANQRAVALTAARRSRRPGHLVAVLHLAAPHLGSRDVDVVVGTLDGRKPWRWRVISRMPVISSVSSSAGSARSSRLPVERLAIASAAAPPRPPRPRPPRRPRRRGGFGSEGASSPRFVGVGALRRRRSAPSRS